MAIVFHRGMAGTGDGKTYCLVNIVIREFLLHTKKEIFTTCPCDGEQKEYFLADCFPKGQLARRLEAGKRLNFMYEGQSPWYQEWWEKPVSSLDIRENLLQYESGLVDKFDVSEALSEGSSSGEVWVRVAWPVNDDMRRYYQAEGYRYRREQGGVSCRLGNFWRHAPSGSVVVIDEIADIFGSDEMSGQKQARMEFNQFLRQHRHYKFDLHFCAQNVEDVDVKARRLIEREFLYRNLKKTAFIDHWAFRSMRWPVQCFEVREHMAVNTRDKSGEQILRMIPVDSYKVFPKARGFKNYRSFSDAAKLAGKAMADETVRSGDLDTPWDRVRGFAKNIWKLVAIAGFMACAVYLFTTMVYGMAGANSNKVGKLLFGFKDHTNAIIQYEKSNKTNVVAGVGAGGAGVVRVSSGSVAVVPRLVETNSVASVAVVFRCSEFFRLSDGRRFRLGDKFAGYGSVVGITQSGVLFARQDGYGFGFCSWGILFPGG